MLDLERDAAVSTMLFKLDLRVPHQIGPFPQFGPHHSVKRFGGGADCVATLLEQLLLYVGHLDDTRHFALHARHDGGWRCGRRE